MGKKGCCCLRRVNRKVGLERVNKSFCRALVALLGILLLSHATVAEAQPVIIQNPTNAVVPPRKQVVLSVLAQGTGRLKYRWEMNGRLIAARRPVIKFRAQPWRVGTYRAIVTDATGQQVASRSVTVEVKLAPVILVQPRDTTVLEHDTAVFEVVLNDSGPYTTIVWHNDNPREGSHQIPDGIGLEVHKPRLVIPNSLNVDYFNGLYWIAVTNRAGGTVSRKATLTVLPRPN